MKHRGKFGQIDIDNKIFKFTWARHFNDTILVLYNEEDKKIEISYKIWSLYPDSEEYTSGLHAFYKYKLVTWHGKHKKGPEFAGYGKRQARELYFKYLKHIKLTKEESDENKH